MQPLVTESATRRRSIDPLDVDLLETLETLDKSLYAVVSAATIYRSILHEQIQVLRAGKDPEMVQGALLRWQNILADVKRFAGHL